MMSILLKQPERPGDSDNPVRTVLSAAAPPERWREFEQRFGLRIVEFYGMVDSPGFLLNTEGRVGSMGKPIAGIEFAVVDDDDRPLPHGEIGELVFRHPLGQTTHYHKLPDATTEAYRGGWFHSGDLAVMDADGWFYYKGRKKESMRRLGENISAWEIESVLTQHPEVLECGAHAVRSDLGEDEVKVVVVPQPGIRPPKDCWPSAPGRWLTMRSRVTSRSWTPCPRRRPIASVRGSQRPGPHARHMGPGGGGIQGDAGLKGGHHA